MKRCVFNFQAPRAWFEIPRYQCTNTVDTYRWLVRYRSTAGPTALNLLGTDWSSEARRPETRLVRQTVGSRGPSSDRRKGRTSVRRRTRPVAWRCQPRHSGTRKAGGSPGQSHRWCLPEDRSPPTKQHSSSIFYYYSLIGYHSFRTYHSFSHWCRRCFSLTRFNLSVDFTWLHNYTLFSHICKTSCKEDVFNSNTTIKRELKMHAFQRLQIHTSKWQLARL